MKFKKDIFKINKINMSFRGIVLKVRVLLKVGEKLEYIFLILIECCIYIWNEY